MKKALEIIKRINGYSKSNPVAYKASLMALFDFEAFYKTNFYYPDSNTRMFLEEMNDKIKEQKNKILILDKKGDSFRKLESEKELDKMRVFQEVYNNTFSELSSLNYDFYKKLFEYSEKKRKELLSEDWFINEVISGIQKSYTDFNIANHNYIDRLYRKGKNVDEFKNQMSVSTLNYYLLCYAVQDAAQTRDDITFPPDANSEELLEEKFEKLKETFKNKKEIGEIAKYLDQDDFEKYKEVFRGTRNLSDKSFKKLMRNLKGKIK